MRAIHQQLRAVMFNPVVLERDANGRVSDQIFLFDVGITTVGRDGAPGDQLIGVLQIDEDRLRQALEENPERVQALFAGGGLRPSGTMEERNARSPYVGLGFRLDDALNNIARDGRGSLQQRAGYNSGLNVSENIMSRQLRAYDRRIDAMQAFLHRRENHFFSMFARMENAMAQAHSQMDSLFAFGQQ
jgi:flagellar hook-associated protein 2